MNTVIINSKDAVRKHYDASELSFHIKMEESGGILFFIRVSANVTVKSGSGNAFLVGYDSGSVILGSGSYNLVSLIDDDIIIENADNLLDFYVVSSKHGLISNFHGFNRPFREINFGSYECPCCGLNISEIAANSHSTLQKLIVIGGFGKMDDIEDCTNLSILDVSYCDIYGDISQIPSSVVTFSNHNGEITGDIGQTPSGLTSFSASNVALNYTTRKTWAENMVLVNVSIYNSTDIDNLLTDLANTTWTETKLIKITGGKRTSNSDSAVSTLEGMGVTVQCQKAV